LPSLEALRGKLPNLGTLAVRGVAGDGKTDRG
jgi:hypothetical protein